MRKFLLVFLMLTVSIASAGVTSFGGWGFKGKVTYTADGTDISNRYSIVELDSTDAALSLSIVTASVTTKVINTYTSTNAVVTANSYVYSNKAKDGQMMIIYCKDYTETITLNAASVLPAPTDSTYTFTQAGDSVLLYYSDAKKSWIEMYRAPSMGGATDNISVVTLNVTGTGTITNLGATKLAGNINANSKNISSIGTATITTANISNGNIAAERVTADALIIADSLRVNIAPATGLDTTANAAVTVNINGTDYHLLLKSL